MMPGRAFAVVVSLALVSGCYNFVPLNPQFQARYEVATIPLKVGILYTPEFSNRHIRILDEADLFDFALGKASTKVLDQAFAALFEHTAVVTSLDQVSQSTTNLAAVIEPKIEEFSIHPPQDTRNIYGADIKYRFNLYSTKGDRLGSWTVTGIASKRPANIWAYSRARGMASDLAMQEAAKQLLIGFREVPEVRRWLSDAGVPLPKLVEGSSGQTIHNLEKTLSGHMEAVSTVAFSPDGRLLASGSRDKAIRLWEVASGLPLKTLDGHFMAVSSVAFSPDGKVLVSGSWDKSICVWDVASGELVKKLVEPDDPVIAVAFDRAGRFVAASGRRRIQFWDIASGVVVKTLLGHDKSVSGHPDSIDSLAFSPDGKILASGSTDSSIRLWDVGSGDQLKILKGHTSQVLSVVLSPNGKLLASGSVDQSIRLWDVASGNLRRTLSGLDHAVTSVAFSPDGRFLASGSARDDNTIYLWDVASGNLLDTFRGGPIVTSRADVAGESANYAAYVYAVAFSIDGKFLASGGADKAVHLWNVSPVATPSSNLR